MYKIKIIGADANLSHTVNGKQTINKIYFHWFSFQPKPLNLKAMSLIGEMSRSDIIIVTPINTNGLVIKFMKFPLGICAIDPEEKESDITVSLNQS